MRMMLAVAAMISLAACTANVSDQEADMRAAESRLPEGCKINFAGQVRVAGEDTFRPANVFVVQCPKTDASATSATYDRRSGKTTVSEYNVAIEMNDQ